MAEASGNRAPTIGEIPLTLVGTLGNRSKPVGVGANFDGNEANYLTIADGSNLIDKTKPWGVSILARPDTANAGTVASCFNTPSNGYFYVRFSATGKIGVFVNNNGTVVGIDTTDNYVAGKDYAIFAWLHPVSGGYHLRLRVNDQPTRIMDDVLLTLPTLGAGVCDIRVGQRQTAETRQPFDGMIASFAIWNEIPHPFAMDRQVIISRMLEDEVLKETTSINTSGLSILSPSAVTLTPRKQNRSREDINWKTRLLYGFAGENPTVDNPSVMFNLLGAHPNLVQNYKFFPKANDQNGDGDSASFFPQTFLNNVASIGAIPCITWEIWRFIYNPVLQKTEKLGIPHAEIMSGGYDTWLEYYCNRLKQHGKLVLIRFLHEANLRTPVASGGYPWGGVTEADNDETTPDKCIDIWRYFVQFFRDRNADNVKWVWCPLANNVPSTAVLSWNAMVNYYPGHEWVDGCGLDFYSGKHSPTATFETRALTGYPEIAAIMGDHQYEIPFTVYETNNYYQNDAEWEAWVLDAAEVCIRRNWWMVLFHVPSKEWVIRTPVSQRTLAYYDTNASRYKLPIELTLP